MSVEDRKARLYRATSRAARYSAYAGVALTAVVAWGLIGLLGRQLDVDPGWEDIDFAALEEVELLQRYLRIDTTEATGDELQGAEFLADLFRREGMEVEILEMGAGRANLVATLEGDDPRPLILHSHLDLDPIAEPEAWIHPPFSGTIEVPWIYGRGAFDMKSVTIAQVLAMIDLKRQGTRPNRRVVFLATSAEEIDSETGTLWLLRHRPDIFEGAWGLLTEGGVLEARGVDDVKYWGTEFAQKRYVKVIVCSRDRDRLETLRADILTRGLPLDGRRLTPAVAEFLDHYAGTRDHPRHRELLSSPRHIERSVAAYRELPLYLRALFRDELHPFPVVERPGGGYQMRITLSLLEDTALEDAVERLLPQWMTAGLEIQIQVEPSSPDSSPIDHPLFRGIESTLEERFGPIPTGPYFQARSATDARFFRAWDIPSYGFTPFLALTTDTLAISGPNEGIALPAYVDGVQLYKDLLRHLVAD